MSVKKMEAQLWEKYIETQVCERSVFAEWAGRTLIDNSGLDCVGYLMLH